MECILYDVIYLHNNRSIFFLLFGLIYVLFDEIILIFTTIILTCNTYLKIYPTVENHDCRL